MLLTIQTAIYCRTTLSNFLTVTPTVTVTLTVTIEVYVTQSVTVTINVIVTEMVTGRIQILLSELMQIGANNWTKMMQIWAENHQSGANCG